jgi:hypothetical protein
MYRPSHIFAVLALCVTGVAGFSQGTGAAYRDPQGRFSLRVPNGWTTRPLDDAVELKRGNALVSVLVSEGGQDPSSLLASLAGQMGSQWKTFTRTQQAGSTLGGQEAVYGVYTGLNRTGAGSLLKIVAASTGRRCFALIMSSPADEFRDAKAGFDEIELGFRIGGAAAPAVPGGTAPSQRPPQGSYIPPGGSAPAPAPTAGRGSNGKLPDRPVPAGFTLSSDPRGTGRVLLSSFTGNARSAMVTAQGLLGSLRGYFDNVPAVHFAVRDDADRRVQAFFSAAIQNVPVTGIMGVKLNGGGGTTSVVFDRAGSLRESYGRLLGKPVPPLRPVNLPDGSTIGVPDGWRLNGSGKGSVDVAGPNGQDVSLGAAAPVYSRAANMPGMPQGYLLTGTCCDPARAMAEVTPQIFGHMQRSGQPALQLVRILDARSERMGSGQSGFIMADLMVAGRPSQAFCYVVAAPTGIDQWMFYLSMVLAPSEAFPSEAPTLLAVWNSYNINPNVFKERMDNAIKNMNAGTQSVLSAARESSRVREAADEKWDRVIRGTDTIVDASTGRRYVVDNQVAQELVDRLNGAGDGNWKVVDAAQVAPRK